MYKAWRPKITSRCTHSLEWKIFSLTLPYVDILRELFSSYDSLSYVMNQHSRYGETNILFELKQARVNLQQACDEGHHVKKSQVSEPEMIVLTKCKVINITHVLRLMILYTELLINVFLKRPFYSHGNLSIAWSCFSSVVISSQIQSRTSVSVFIDTERKRIAIEKRHCCIIKL